MFTSILAETGMFFHVQYVSIQAQIDTEENGILCSPSVRFALCVHRKQRVSSELSSLSCLLALKWFKIALMFKLTGPTTCK